MRITADINGEQIEKYVDSDIEMLQIGNIHKNYTKITGLPILDNLRTLKFVLVTTDLDLSFLLEMPNLETLIFESCRIDNLDFIPMLRNIHIIYVNETRVRKRVITLQNSSLEVFAFVRSYTFSDGVKSEPEILNIPGSLLVMDLRNSASLSGIAKMYQPSNRIPLTIIADKDIDSLSLDDQKKYNIVQKSSMTDLGYIEATKLLAAHFVEGFY